MVSLIDHVVMNHQNQTRTNGIWGHVRYTGRLVQESEAGASLSSSADDVADPFNLKKDGRL
jgi:hypothetical protein